MKALSLTHQPDRVARKGSDVPAADWRYQTHLKKYRIFHVCCYGFSQGWKSVYNTVVYMIKKYYLHSLQRCRGAYLFQIARKDRVIT